MAQVILELSLSGSRKADGSPNAGGKVFGFQVGSGGVAATLWKDWQKLSAWTQPVVLDGAGKAEIWVDQAVDLRIEDSAGTLVSSTTAATQSNAGAVEVLNAGFTGTSPSDGTIAAGQRTTLDAVLTSLFTSVGGADGNYLAAPGATARPVRDWLRQFAVTPQDFGAKGDGVKDDTTAMQAANSYAVSAGRSIFLPAGTYLISAALTVSPAVGQTLRIFGVGPGSLIRQTNTAADCFQIATIATLMLESVAIDHLTSSSGIAINAFIGSPRVLMQRTKISAFETCVKVADVNQGPHRILECDLAARSASVAGCVIGLGSAPMFIAGSAVTGGTGAGVGVAWSSSGTLVVSGCTVSAPGGTGAGVTISAGTLIAAASDVSGGTNAISPSSSATVFTDAACRISGGAVNDTRTNKQDGAAYSYATQDVTGGSTATLVHLTGVPIPTAIAIRRFKATSAGTVTVPDPGSGTTAKMSVLVVECFNSSGGAVTWSFAATYKTSGAINPATGSRTTLWFHWDATESLWIEGARGTVT